MNQLLESAKSRSIRFLKEIQTRHVGHTPAGREGLKEFDEPMPPKGTDPENVLQILDKVGTPATMGIAGPRFFGFVIGGSLPITLAANWLAGAWDQNSGLYEITPTTAYLEEVSLKWLNEIFGFPPSTRGAFVTGATVANFTALAAARHAVLKKTGWDVEADGLFGAPPIDVIIGAEAHPTLTKSLGLLGLGRTRLIKAPVDNQGRMRMDAFPKVKEPAIVCLQAGNVNTGAVDPLAELIARAHKAGAWVHVDGAFGLWATAAPSHKYLVEGITHADSWATDAHKWLNVPYDSGLAFVRDPNALQAAMAITAEYLPSKSPFRNPSDFTPELSRRGRGVEIWAALKYLGKDGLAEMIERTCRHARRFSEGLNDAGFTILNDVVLNQVLVSFGSADVTSRIIQEIQTDGTCWCGGTVWQGHTAMRISVSSWATTEDDVEKSLEAMIRIARPHRTT
ncbi:MAG TPA: aminotransferase class V-fold PLP-dependent enzyme [Bacteroidota bacterium]